MFDRADEPALRSVIQSRDIPVNTKARNGLSSTAFYQILVFPHSRKTQPGLPGYVANPLPI
jgi:hypothetical protein